MPTLSINIDVTVNQETKARQWYTRVSAEMTNPPATLEDYLYEMVVDHLTAGIQSQDAPDFATIWETLTVAQKAQIKEIAELKMRDLHAVDIEGAMRMIEGTARSMGITVAG